MKLSGKLVDKLVRSRGIFMFIRSSISSQISGYVDIVVSIGLVALHVSEWLATPLGAVAGGIVNCCLNYRFTFRVSGYSRRAVAVKFFFVWVMSLILNTVGTGFLASLLDQWQVLARMSFTFLGSYAMARLITSALVSLLWNYPMQYKFVYQANCVDRFAIKAFDIVSLRNIHNKPTDKIN